MLHLIAFDGNNVLNTALTQNNALASEFETISNNGVIIQTWPLILGATHYSAHSSRAQLRAPSIQFPDYPLIQPVAIARPTSAIAQIWSDFSNGPIAVKEIGRAHV